MGRPGTARSTRGQGLSSFRCTRTGHCTLVGGERVGKGWFGSGRRRLQSPNTRGSPRFHQSAPCIPIEIGREREAGTLTKGSFTLALTRFSRDRAASLSWRWVPNMNAPLTPFEAEVALAEMIVKLLAKEASTNLRVSPLCGVIRCTECGAFLRHANRADFPPPRHTRARCRCRSSPGPTMAIAT